MSRRKIKSKEEESNDNLDPTKDEFVKHATSAFDWAYERRRLIGLLVGVAFVAALTAVVVDHFMTKSAAKQTVFLAAGLDAVTAPVKKVNDQTPPAEEKTRSEELSFDSVKARATESLKRFQEAASKTSGTVSVLAELGKGTSYFDLGEFDKAIASYEKVLASTDSSIAWLKPNVVDALAIALSAAGKPGDALKRYDNLVSDESLSASRVAKYEAARLAEKQGDKERAKKLLVDLLASYKKQGDESRLEYAFVQGRERMLALDPNADVPALPSSGLNGLEGIDPAILQQLLKARAGGAGN